MLLLRVLNYAFIISLIFTLLNIVAGVSTGAYLFGAIAVITLVVIIWIAG